MRPNSRRSQRFSYGERVRLSWHDSQGQVKYAHAKCLDVSDSGMAIELLEPVEVRSYVSLKADALKLAGSAAVRYCRRYAGKYFIGLEFSAGLRCTNLPAELVPVR